MSVLHKTSPGDNKVLKREKRVGPTSQEDNDIKTHCEGGKETLKRGRDAHLPSIGENHKTSNADGKITLHRGEDRHWLPIGDRQNSVRTSRYGRPTTSTPKGGVKTLRRDNIERVLTFIANQERGEKTRETQNRYFRS